MQVQQFDGTKFKYDGLTEDEVIEKTRQAVANPETDEIRIWPDGPNRHQRRKAAAEARKKQKPSK
jgi:hypothetical protein